MVITHEVSTRTVPVTVPAREVRTVWLTNPNGARTSVALKAADGGMWVGPRGEYYDQLPGEDQLLPVYGLMAGKTAATTNAAANAVVETSQTIWLTNTNGSRTAVELVPAGGGAWKGPKGEIYDRMPAIEQLESVYGLK